MEFYDVAIPQEVQPSLALSVETEELGIAAGLAGPRGPGLRGPGLHGFRPGEDARGRRLRVRRVRAARSGAVAAAVRRPTTPTASEPTEVLHNNLRVRFEQGEPAVVEAMARLAELTVEARRGAAGGRARAAGPLDRRRISTCGGRSAGCRPSRSRWSSAPGAPGRRPSSPAPAGRSSARIPDEATLERLKAELGCDRLPRDRSARW